MELHADLEDSNREHEHVTQDIAKAMHLSFDFLQSVTDLIGNFERLVLPCLDLANRITYEMDTSERGDPEAVSTIKRLRCFQSERMHQLRERREDILQTASEFDESATFEQLSDINWNILKIPPGRHGLKPEALWPLVKKNSDTVLMTPS